MGMLRRKRIRRLDRQIESLNYLISGLSRASEEHDEAWDRRCALLWKRDELRTKENT